ncbi:SDR family NAD(P)-dependent oxidoreductase [Francisella salimarina]|uniref:SDR family NAD(P)-dependent oxidoreductase n=1 Tax=Francisella salimarina TaxID=2599927 RepID=UPI003D812F66
MKKVAIIGYSFVLPEGISSDRDLWQALEQSKDLVSEIPNSRIDKKRFLHLSKKKAGKSYSFSAGVIPGIEEFDSTLFNISSREASKIDPQQRMLLNHTYFALQKAGYIPEKLSGENYGVYVGASNPDYSYFSVENGEEINSYTMTGAAKSIIANRVSYSFNFKGPSMVVDTACSSSLVALDIAVKAIQANQIDTAIVGGVNCLLHHTPFIGFSKAHMMSPTGRCRSFSAEADGYVRSEGCVVVVVKDFQKALADGDTIYALVNKTAVNSDGKTSGLPLPSYEAQRDLLEDIYDEVDLDDLLYIEAHGTGTPVGDPLEIQAIAESIASKKKSSLITGSIKSNIGHLEPASGLAGVIKALLILQNKRIPANIHFDKPNPKLQLQRNNIEIPSEIVDIDVNKESLIGINSFGFGGTNAHVLLQAYLEKSPTKRYETAEYFSDKLILKTHSAKLLADQKKLTKEIINNQSSYYSHSIASQCYRSTRGFFALYDSFEDFSDNKSRDYDIGFNSKNVALLFAGNGCQYSGMLRLLHESSELTSYLGDTISELQEITEMSLKDWLAIDSGSYSDTRIAQPALFIFQVSIVKYLLNSGINVQAVLGHSVGEIAAAYTSGILSLSEAYRLVVARSNAQAITHGKGTMLAVNITREKYRSLIVDLELSNLDIAAINAQDSLTIAGDAKELRVLAGFCETQGVFNRFLDVEYPFHSRYMDRDVKSEFDVRFPRLDSNVSDTSSDFISTVFAKKLSAEELCSSEYWWKNIVQPVDFASAIINLLNSSIDTFVEVTPRVVLRNYLNKISDGFKINYFSTVEKSRLTCRDIIDKLYLSGALWNIAVCYNENTEIIKSQLDLKYHWYAKNNKSMICSGSELLGWQVTSNAKTWISYLDYQLASDFHGHQVRDDVVLPASAWLELLYQLVKKANDLDDSSIILLKDIQIYAPLLLQKDDMRTLISTSNQDGSVVIKSISQYGNNESLHIKARYLLQNIDSKPIVPQNLDLSEVVVSATKHYSNCKSIGLNYVDRFAIVNKIQLGINSAIVFFDEENYHQNYAQSPFSIDGGFQAIISLLCEFGSNLSNLFLPTGFDFNYILRSYARIEKAVIKLRYKSSNLIVADIYYTDLADNLISFIKGARFESVANSIKGLLPQDCFVESLKPFASLEHEYVRSPRLPCLRYDDIEVQEQQVIIGFIKLLIAKKAYQDAQNSEINDHNSSMVKIVKDFPSIDILDSQLREMLQLLFVEFPNLLKPLLLCYKALLSLGVNDFKLTQSLKDIDTLWQIALITNIESSIKDIIGELQKAYSNIDNPLKVLVVGAGVQRQVFERIATDSLEIQYSTGWSDLYEAVNDTYDCIFIESHPSFAKNDYVELVLSKLKSGGIAKFYIWLTSLESQVFTSMLDSKIQRVPRKAIDDVLLQTESYDADIKQSALSVEVLLQKPFVAKTCLTDLPPLRCQKSIHGTTQFSSMIHVEDSELPAVIVVDKDCEYSSLYKILQQIHTTSSKNKIVILESSWRDGVLSSPLHQSLLASLRVFVNENPEVSITRVVTKNLYEVLDWNFILDDRYFAQEIFIEKDVIYQHYIKHLKLNDLEHQYKLVITNRGSFSHLKWLTKQSQNCTGDDVCIKVHYTGLNFRDIMYSLGLIPQESLEFGFLGAYLGMEFSGEVIDIGDNVSDFKIGDRVFGCAQQSFATELVVNQNFIAKLPQTCSMQQGSTMLVAFMTSYYAIKELARAKPGQKILIHGGAGAIGLAAIQVAHLLDLEIYTTVGSLEKKLMVESLGVTAVYDSRSTDFLMELENSNIKVDIVLNSLSNDLLEASLAVLAPFGHFIELGKRDIFDNNSLAMKVFRNNITFSGIDLDQLIKYKPELIQQMLVELTAYFDDQTLMPLPYQEFTMGNIQEAFRCMQQGRQLGKVIVNMQTKDKAYLDTWSNKKANINGAYIVTGGTQGFGFYSAIELAKHGATELILISRSGTISLENRNKLDEVGVSYEILSLDVSNEASVRDLMLDLYQKGVDLKGIVHAAVVYDDIAFSEMSKHSFDKVFEVKAIGGQWLSKYSNYWRLEHFIMFSSIATVVGNINQSNYVAANAYLEGLVAQRREQGLTAQYIAWGPIADFGLLTRDQNIKKLMESGLGFAPLSSIDTQRIINEILLSEKSHIIASKFEGSRIAKVLPVLKTLRYQEVIAQEQAKTISSLDLDTLRASPKQQSIKIVQTNVLAQVASILGVNINGLALSTDLRDLGMDSLMAFELAVSLEEKFTGITISAMSIAQLKTSGDIVDMILRHIYVDDSQDSNSDDILDIIKQRHGES